MTKDFHIFLVIYHINLVKGWRIHALRVKKKNTCSNREMQIIDFQVIFLLSSKSSLFVNDCCLSFFRPFANKPINPRRHMEFRSFSLRNGSW